MRSQRAELIRQSTAIIWDEAANQHRNHFHAFRRLLEDVAPPALAFVVLSGDFR
jgi:rubrerythrin